MKLRMTHNSIRIRMRKSELQELQTAGSCSDQVGFPNGNTLTFSISLSSEHDHLRADLSDHTIAIYVPNEVGMQWIETNKVGMSMEVPLSKDASLSLLIEKDFPCLDRPNEDKSDTFWELAPEQPKSC